jgi:hypothetical protein
MATKPLTRKGKPTPAKAAEAETAVGVVLAGGAMATAKLTVSIKRRLSNGDEIFLAPGIEMHCEADALEDTKVEVTDKVNAWMETLLEAYPDVDLDASDADEEEADAEDEEADADEEGDDLTPEDVAAMKLAELKTTIIDYGLEIEPKGMKLADLREAVTAELWAEEDADAEDEDEDEAEDGDEDEDEDAGYTDAELKGMKLEELQAVVDAWGLDHPEVKKGAPAAAKKKAYIAYILEVQEEE